MEEDLGKPRCCWLVGWLGFQLGFLNSNLPNYNPPSFEICWLGFQFCHNLPNFPNSDKNCQWNQLTAAPSAIQIVNQGSSHSMFHAVPQLAGLGSTKVLGKATSMNILDVKTCSSVDTARCHICKSLHGLNVPC